MSLELPKALTWEEMQDTLNNNSSSIQQLYRAIFCMKHGAPSRSDAVELLADALHRKIILNDESKNTKPAFQSVLFRHECCYLLGQFGADDTTDIATKKRIYYIMVDVLEDELEDEVTRHEAAEGLAAILNFASVQDESEELAAGMAEVKVKESISTNTENKSAIIDETSVNAQSADSAAETKAHTGAETNNINSENNDITSSLPPRSHLIDLLEKHAKIPDSKTGKTPLSETCQIALEGLKREKFKMCACQFASFDPAVGEKNISDEDIPRFEKMIKDGTDENGIYNRYVAMFSLRNLKAYDKLAACLDNDDTSPVLRHELCFILGQCEAEISVEALGKCLAKPAHIEHAMVRHEAAIALGTIGGEDAKKYLEEYKSDAEPMVAESCLVALDTLAYWEAWEEFERRVNAS